MIYKNIKKWISMIINNKDFLKGKNKWEFLKFLEKEYKDYFKISYNKN